MKKKVLYVCTTTRPCDPAGRRRMRSSCTARCAVAPEIEPVLVARTGRERRRIARRGTPAPLQPGRETTRTSTSSTPRPTASTSSSGPTATSLSTPSTRGLPAHLQAGRRALPAHALHRLRPRHAHPPAAAGRADRLHAARVPARSATATASWCARRASSSARDASPRRCNECFPGLVAAALLPARAADQVAPLTRGPVPGAEQLPARALRGLGDPAREAHVRGLRPHPETPVPRPPVERPRNRLGFFGQISPYKGVEILLAGDAAS